MTRETWVPREAEVQACVHWNGRIRTPAELESFEDTLIYTVPVAGVPPPKHDATLPTDSPYCTIQAGGDHQVTEKPVNNTKRGHRDRAP